MPAQSGHESGGNLNNSSYSALDTPVEYFQTPFQRTFDCLFLFLERLSYSLFKWSLILQPKLILQPNLRYVNEIPLCERNLDFATEINHFATELTILQPN